MTIMAYTLVGPITSEQWKHSKWKVYDTIAGPFEVVQLRAIS